MPRQPRLELPGVPLHVTQRGVNRCAIFIDDADRQHDLQLLRVACLRHAVAVHAYVLMDNHVHLLLSTPAAGQVPRALRLAGQSYVQAFNHRHGRTGTQWPGRFKSSLVDTDGYLLTVMRYIELNPVRAAIVERAVDHRWSSVHAHADGVYDPLLTLHPLYLALGADSGERCAGYRTWLHATLDSDELARFRAYMQQERALGQPRFQAMVANR